MLLEDRVVLVSGIGPGMGRSLAVGAARQGAHVVLAARSPHNLDPVAEEVRALGRTALPIPTDITDPDAVAALVSAAMSELGRIDVLVNNAFMQPPLERLEDVEPDTWRTAFEVNLFGTVSVTDAVLPHMRDAGSGSVVFIASMSARRVRENFAVYSASKAALLTTMQHYANEHGRDGIRANAVVPGYIHGPNLKFWFDYQAKQRGVDPEVVYDEVASETALHHLPTPDEVADAAIFLASDMAGAITGAAVDVNGGNWFH